MKIRAITAFVEIHADDTETTLARAATFLHAAAYAFHQAGITVQTRRVATQPFPQIDYPLGPVGMPALASRMREESTSYGIDSLALGPVRAGDDPDYLDAVPDIFRAVSGVFASVEIGHPAYGVDLDLLRHAASVIREVSTITHDGLSNLHLGAMVNCEPGVPFFPAAYHTGGPPRFALAVEAADLAVIAFQDAETPGTAQQRLTDMIERAAQQLTPIAGQLAEDHGFTFGGIDFSLAPYPGPATSLGAAIEQLGVRLGGAGMVGAVALVMNAIEAANFPHCGFNGLMLPVLEDSLMGQRAAEGALGLKDLLLYSALCGTGLDCIPLPGDVSEDVLAAILLDVAALGLRLDKPLTARLMPLPGKAAGDPVAFPQYEYFAPSRVLAPPPGLSAGAFASRSTFTITPRR
jgi:uncharacterized protein